MVYTDTLDCYIDDIWSMNLKILTKEQERELEEGGEEVRKLLKG